MGVSISSEGARGCGFRAVGGLYMMGGRLSAACGKLPIRLDRCLSCGAGIKFSRGFTWVDPVAIFEGGPCETSGDEITPGVVVRACALCPVANPPERAGLLWVGERFYPTPAHFTAEAEQMGVSKRISAIPRAFVLGRDWVFLAHPKAIPLVCDCTVRDGAAVIATAIEGGEVRRPEPEPDCESCGGSGTVYGAGIFSVFKPTSFEKVVDEDVSDDEVADLEKRGIEPVIVRRVGESEALALH